MEIKPNMIIRCKTYKEAFDLCHKVIKNKSINYITGWIDYWKIYKSDTCYQVNNNCDSFYFYGDTDAFKDKEITLYSDLFKETTDDKSKNLSNPKEVITTMENIQEHYNDLAVFVRNKTIDEFVKKIKELYKDNSVKEDRHHRAIVLPYSKIIEVSEEMKNKI